MTEVASPTTEPSDTTGQWHRMTDERGGWIRERRVPLTVALYVVAVVAAWLGRFVQDDAFITYRFSRNMARGDGLVFNPGERVEGYTNFLWTVVHALPERYGWSTPAFSQILGIVTMVAALAAALRLGRRLLGSEERALFAGAVLVANMTFVGYGTGGLETMLQTALVTWIAVLVLGGGADHRVSPAGRVAAGVLAGLAVLTRLDSAVLVGGWFVAHLWREWRRPDRQVSAMVKAAAQLAAPAVVLVGPWLVWKLRLLRQPVAEHVLREIGRQPGRADRGRDLLRRVVLRVLRGHPAHRTLVGAPAGPPVPRRHERRPRRDGAVASLRRGGRRRLHGVPLPGARAPRSGHRGVVPHRPLSEPPAPDHARRRAVGVLARSHRLSERGVPRAQLRGTQPLAERVIDDLDGDGGEAGRDVPRRSRGAGTTPDSGCSPRCDLVLLGPADDRHVGTVGCSRGHARADPSPSTTRDM